MANNTRMHNLEDRRHSPPAGLHSPPLIIVDKKPLYAGCSFVHPGPDAKKPTWQYADQKIWSKTQEDLSKLAKRQYNGHVDVTDDTPLHSLPLKAQRRIEDWLDDKNDLEREPNLYKWQLVTIKERSKAGSLFGAGKSSIDVIIKRTLRARIKDAAVGRERRLSGSRGLHRMHSADDLLITGSGHRRGSQNFAMDGRGSALNTGRARDDLNHHAPRPPMMGGQQHPPMGGFNAPRGPGLPAMNTGPRFPPAQVEIMDSDSDNDSDGGGSPMNFKPQQPLMPNGPRPGPGLGGPMGPGGQGMMPGVPAMGQFPVRPPMQMNGDIPPRNSMPAMHGHHGSNPPLPPGGMGPMGNVGGMGMGGVGPMGAMGGTQNGPRQPQPMPNPMMPQHGPRPPQSMPNFSMQQPGPLPHHDMRNPSGHQPGQGLHGLQGVLNMPPAPHAPHVPNHQNVQMPLHDGRPFAKHPGKHNSLGEKRKPVIHQFSDDDSEVLTSCGSEYTVRTPATSSSFGEEVPHARGNKSHRRDSERAYRQHRRRRSSDRRPRRMSEEFVFVDAARPRLARVATSPGRVKPRPGQAVMRHGSHGNIDHELFYGQQREHRDSMMRYESVRDQRERDIDRIDVEIRADEVRERNRQLDAAIKQREERKHRAMLEEVDRKLARLAMEEREDRQSSYTRGPRGYRDNFRERDLDRRSPLDDEVRARWSGSVGRGIDRRRDDDLYRERDFDRHIGRDIFR